MTGFDDSCGDDVSTDVDRRDRCGRDEHRGRQDAWGGWLRSTEDQRGGPVFVDGRAWRSVREAFWVARLGMLRVTTADGQMDAMLEVMDWIAGGGRPSEGPAGAGPVAAFLVLRGLAYERERLKLTDEGQAVRTMLRETCYGPRPCSEPVA